MHDTGVSAAGNTWSARPFSALESALILIFHDCIVHSCFANLRDLTYRKV